LEHQTQAAICRMLGLEIAAPGRLSPKGVVWWCVDVADFAGVPGTRVARGVIAGVPDLFLLHRGKTFFIEIKRAGAGVLSPPQQWLLPVLAAAGSAIGTAERVEDVLALLDTWGIPRAHRTTLAA
jgi:hypothetical protein